MPLLRQRNSALPSYDGARRRLLEADDDGVDAEGPKGPRGSGGGGTVLRRLLLAAATATIALVALLQIDARYVREYQGPLDIDFASSLSRPRWLVP